MERTLLIIQPEALKEESAIIDTLLTKGFKILTVKLISINKTETENSTYF
jgi:nucleoside diphosphate kinase